MTNNKSVNVEKEAKQDAVPEQTVLSPALTDSNLDTIRDILFGAEIKKSDEARNDLELSFSQELKGFRNDMAQQLDQIRQDMQQQVAAQTKETAENLAEANSQLANVHESIAQSARQSEAADNELSEQLESALDTLGKQLEQWKVDLGDRLDKVHDQLSYDKTDRRALSAVFAQMSEQLIQDDQTG